MCTYTKTINPCPVGIASKEVGIWSTAVRKGENRGSLETGAHRVGVSHVVVVDLVEVVARGIGTCKKRSEEWTTRGLFMVGANQVQADIAVCTADVVI